VYRAPSGMRWYIIIGRWNAIRAAFRYLPSYGGYNPPQLSVAVYCPDPWVQNAPTALLITSRTLWWPSSVRGLVSLILGLWKVGSVPLLTVPVRILELIPSVWWPWVMHFECFDVVVAKMCEGRWRSACASSMGFKPVRSGPGHGRCLTNPRTFLTVRRNTTLATRRTPFTLREDSVFYASGSK